MHLLPILRNETPQYSSNPSNLGDNLTFFSSYINYVTTGNRTFSSSINVDGTFIINAEHIVTFLNSTIFFAPNAKIIVKPGGKLILNACTLTNVCSGQLWQGIEIWGNPSNSDQAISSQGALDMKNGTIIKNAVCAIRAGNSSASGYGGGIIIVKNSKFQNNKRAVMFDAYTRKNSNGTENSNRSVFTDCEFITDNNAFFSVDINNKMVYLYGVKDIRFDGCDFLDSKQKSTIDDYGMAIAISSASVRLTGTGFHMPIIHSPSKQCSFSGFYIAIQIQNSGTRKSKIEWSKFEKNFIAIYGGLANQLGVISCTIKSSFDMFSYSTGIYLTTSDGYVIENNVFSGDNGTGIIINNSGEGNNFIKYNTFDELCTGIVSDNVNGQNSNNSVATGLQFLCNNFVNNTVRDVRLHADSRIRFFQGSPSVATGNAFDNSSYQRKDLENASTYHFLYHYANNITNHQPYNPTGQITIVAANTHNCDAVGAMGDYYYTRPVPMSMSSLENEYEIISTTLNRKTSLYGKMDGETSIDWESVFMRRETMEEIPQLELYVEISDLLEKKRLICRDALTILTSTEEFDRKTYNLWLARENVMSSDYLLAQSHIEVSDWEQANHVLQQIPYRFPDEYNEIEHNDFITCLKSLLSDKNLEGTFYTPS
jgi:hypothetical protein